MTEIKHFQNPFLLKNLKKYLIFSEPKIIQKWFEYKNGFGREKNIFFILWSHETFPIRAQQ